MNLDFVIGFDTETTGISTSEDRIVTASIVYLDPMGEIIENYEWLIDPGVEIPEGASAVHGVTNERAQAEGMNPVTGVYEIASVLAYYMSNGVAVVAYNASYDFSILNAEIKRHLGYEGFHSFFKTDEVPKVIIDPYVIDKKIDPRRPGKRTLTASASVYGASLENAHASFDDCVAAVEVLRAIWEKFPAMAEGDLSNLHDAQVQWYKEQQQGLAAYFAKKGKEADVNTVWPINTL